MKVENEPPAAHALLVTLELPMTPSKPNSSFLITIPSPHSDLPTPH